MSADVDTRFMTPSQLEVGGRLAFANDRLKSFTTMIMAAWIDAACLGILTVLLVRWWFEGRPNESRWSTYLIYWEYLVSGLATSAYLQGFVMAHFASGFGEYKNFLSVNWLRWAGLHGICARVPASCFFLYRAYRLCDRAIWPIVVWAPMLLVITSMTIATIPLNDRLPYPPSVRNVALAAVAIETVQDGILTATIAIQLYRSKTGWQSTDKMIHKLLLYFAHSQAPVTVVNIAMLLSFVIWPNSTGQILILFQPKTFGICILVVLLTRVKMRQQHVPESNVQTKSITSAVSGMIRSFGASRTMVGQSILHSSSRLGQEGKSTTDVLTRTGGSEGPVDGMSSAAQLIDSKPRGREY